jgi:lipopolysaccharide biosynthesis glycosyltransferase
MSINPIPIFYAADDNYAPYLAVSITSLCENASSDKFYDIHILTSAMSDTNRARITSLAKENCSIVFDDMDERMKPIAGKVSLRDYYSLATYFRIFIAGMFPEYEKAIYIDSDTLVLSDIAGMYETDIGDNLVGGIQENVMLMDVFNRYSSVVLGIPNHEYFNAGIIVMNLKQFRLTDMEGRFIELLNRRSFPVAQDQDYLNLLCHGRVHYFPVEWNLDPVDIYKDKKPLILHYKMHRRPWNYDGVLFGEHFWDYTEKSGYHQDIIRSKNSRTDADAKRDQTVMSNLCALAEREISDVITGKVPCAKEVCPSIA